jgi:phosphate:Na+ symporter
MHVSVLHAIDHLQRLLEALAESRNARTATIMSGEREAAQVMSVHLRTVEQWTLQDENTPAPSLEQASRQIAAWRQSARHALLEQTARGELDADEAEARLQAIRWLDRIGYHAWRAWHHLEQARRDPASAVGASLQNAEPVDDNHEVLPEAPLP